MGNLDEEEFERRLFAAGQQLANPPRFMHGMLRDLGKVEVYLSMVNKSPSESIFNAMGPAIDAWSSNGCIGNPKVYKEPIPRSEAPRPPLPQQNHENNGTRSPIRQRSDERLLDFIVRSFKDLGKMNSLSFAFRFQNCCRVQVMLNNGEPWNVRSCLIMVNLGMNSKNFRS